MREVYSIDRGMDVEDLLRIADEALYRVTQTRVLCPRCSLSSALGCSNLRLGWHFSHQISILDCRVTDKQTRAQVYAYTCDNL